MSAQAVYLKSNNLMNYSASLKKLIEDISVEMNKGITDGLAHKIASEGSDDASLYSFIKNEGYDINYKEYSEFITECKEIVNANEGIIDNLIKEHMSEELTEVDLEHVSGGKLKLWQKILIGVGVAVLFAVICIATAGVGGALVGGAVAGATLAGSLAAVSGGVWAAIAIGSVVGGASLAGGLIHKKKD